MYMYTRPHKWLIQCSNKCQETVFWSGVLRVFLKNMHFRRRKIQCVSLRNCMSCGYIPSDLTCRSEEVIDPQYPYAVVYGFSEPPICIRVCKNICKHIFGFVWGSVDVHWGQKQVKYLLDMPSNFVLIFSMQILQSALKRYTVQPFTESDDTRCCENTICPPEDGHVNARKMSRRVV
jgi:hypothetical protein